MACVRVRQSIQSTPIAKLPSSGRVGITRGVVVMIGPHGFSIRAPQFSQAGIGGRVPYHASGTVTRPPHWLHVPIVLSTARLLLASPPEIAEGGHGRGLY